MCESHNFNRHLLIETIYDLGDRGFSVQSLRSQYFQKLKDEGCRDTSLGGGMTVREFVEEWQALGLLDVRGRVFRLSKEYHQ